MDPNATLARLRTLAALAFPTLAEIIEMAELFDALDTWMSKGGFLPAAWSVGR